VEQLLGDNQLVIATTNVPLFSALCNADNAVETLNPQPVIEPSTGDATDGNPPNPSSALTQGARGQWWLIPRGRPPHTITWGQAAGTNRNNLSNGIGVQARESRYQQSSRRASAWRNRNSQWNAFQSLGESSLKYDLSWRRRLRNVWPNTIRGVSS
jgi:hypothetical protein